MARPRKRATVADVAKILEQEPAEKKVTPAPEKGVVFARNLNLAQPIHLEDGTIFLFPVIKGARQNKVRIEDESIIEQLRNVAGQYKLIEI